MLMMFMPSLVCAMSSCPMQKAKSAEMLCHQSGEESAKTPMLLLDCMGVDLFQQNASNDFQLDQTLEKMDYVWADIFGHSSFDLSATHDIRGPPDRLNLPRFEPSIILTTQRLRI